MKLVRVSLALFALALLAAGAGAQAGSVLRSQKISAATGGFLGGLEFGDYFGFGLTPLGDLDGDGVGELAVGAVGDDDGGTDRGAVWLLFLNANGTVKLETKISQTQGGFTGTLVDNGRFGVRLASAGDLDGDGTPELAVLSDGDSVLRVLFLRPDGTVKSHAANSLAAAPFPPGDWRYFSGHYGPGSLISLGDLDGDGLGDLALGAPYDPDGPGGWAGALWILRLRADGKLKSIHKISQTQGGFAGTLEASDVFGYSLTQLGDLDGDGNRELGVGALLSGTQSFWILYLDANELVRDQRAFGVDYRLEWSPGTNGMLPDGFASLGDLDGDGFGDLALGFPRDDFPGGPRDEGGLAVGFLRGDGSVLRRERIGHQRGGFGDLEERAAFGYALAPLGDLNGDGAPELAVSAPIEETTGAVWILSLRPSATRNGSGVNPSSLSQADNPHFGAPWSVTLDCSAHASGLALVFAYDRPWHRRATSLGEVLVAGRRVFAMQLPHTSGPAVFTNAVPPASAALIDLPLFVQGACTGAPGARLSNAVDVLLGR